MQKANRVDKVLFLREAARVRRLHTVTTLRENTVAEHCHNMIDLLLEFFPDHADVKMIKAIQRHDAPERVIGDSPWPSKYPLTGGELSAVLNDAEEVVCDAVGLENFEDELDIEQWAVFKFLDMLELVLSCKDEIMMGNQNATSAYQAGMRVLEESSWWNQDTLLGKELRKLASFQETYPCEQKQWYKEMMKSVQGK